MISPAQTRQVYEERFERAYGFYRPYLRSVIYRYLDCGILRNGFARVRCAECGHEYLLAFSCKRRYFCPSCHQKRVVEFGEWEWEKVLKKVPHLHFVFSIPKILRRYFLYDRSPLSELSHCAWEALRVFFQEVVPQGDGVPDAVIAIQTFEDFSLDGGTWTEGRGRRDDDVDVQVQRDVQRDVHKIIRTMEITLRWANITASLVEQDLLTGPSTGLMSSSE